MNNLIEQLREKAGYRSNDALAKAILKDEPRLEEQVIARSLGGKIGLLAKGKTDWWKNNEMALSSLKKLLDADEADLGIHSAKDDCRYVFREFPELPSLDLRREMPCELASGEPEGRRQSHKKLRAHSLNLKSWLRSRDVGDNRDMPYGVSWLHVPMGTGAELLVAQMKAQSSFEVLQAPSLLEVQSRLQDPRPLVLVISTVNDEDDLLPLVGAENVLVLSPVAWPLADGESEFEFRLNWEFKQGTNQDRARQFLSDPYGNIHRYRWTLHPDWRTLLASWMHDRLNSKHVDTLLDIQELNLWLDKFDPDERLIRTPSDLLAIGRIFHCNSNKSRPKANVRDSFLQLQNRMLMIDSRRVDSFNRVALELWRDTSLKWGCPQEWTTWRKLSGGSSNIQSQGNASKKAVRQDTQLEALRASELLVQVPKTESGDFALNPQLLADLAVRDLLMLEIRTGDFQSWGRTALDPTRQPLVDAALAATPEHELLQTLRELREVDPWEPSAIGASESLFLSLGYRQALGFLLSQETIHIAETVLERYLESGGNYGSQLLISRLHEDRPTHPDALMLMAACLGWSLSHKPKIFRKIDDTLQQKFPGWMGKNPSFPNLPRHPLDDSGIRHSSSDNSPQWRGFLKGVLNVFLQIPGVKWAEEIECSNVAAALRLAAALIKGETVNEDLGLKVVRHKWAESFVLEQMKDRHSQNLAARAFETMLDCAYESLFTGREYGSFEALSLFNSQLWRWAIENTQPQQVIPVKSAKHLKVLRQMPRILPPAFRRELLASLPIEIVWWENQHLIGCAGEESRSLLLERLGTAEGAMAANRLWALNPDETLSLLHSKRGEHMSAVQLVWSSPQSQTSAVAEFLLGNPSLLDKSECRAWVMDRVRSNVDAAEKLFMLLKLASIKSTFKTRIK